MEFFFGQNFLETLEGPDEALVNPGDFRTLATPLPPPASVHVVVIVVVAVVVVVIVIIVVVVIVVVDDRGGGVPETEEGEQQRLEDADVLAVDHQVEHGAVQRRVEELQQVDLGEKKNKFLTQSELIELVLPQAAQLGIHFFYLFQNTQ